jgi:hypothetical protein
MVKDRQGRDVAADHSAKAPLAIHLGKGRLMPGRFDTAGLRALRDLPEIRIRSGSQSGRGVVIWAVVVGDDVFVRSFRGPNASWCKAIVATGQAALEIGDRLIAVRAIPIAEPGTITAVSDAYLAKYATSPYAKEMVRDEILPTTLRLEPL